MFKLYEGKVSQIGDTYRNILVEDLQGFFASTQENDVHVHELHIWHSHKIKHECKLKFKHRI